MNKSIEKILKDAEFLYGQEGNSRSYYEELANFCLPRKAWINSVRVNGDRQKDSFLFDIRAIICAQESVCGFHSYLTNPSARWHESRFVDDKIMQYGKVQRNLKTCDDIMFDVMNDSNFEDAILENYMDHMIFGPGNIMTMEDEKDEVRYNEIPVEQYSFAQDARGRVNEIYWYKTYTASELNSEPDFNLPDEVKKALKEKPYVRMFEVLRYIGPRDFRDPYKQDKVNKAWRYMVILKKPEHLLYEGGFDELPNAVGRWWKDAGGDPRGFSPAMNALASVKLLNAQKRTFIRSAMKHSDPAVLSPNRGFMNTPNFNPSAMNYYDSKKFKVDAFRFLNPEGNPNINIEAMDLEFQVIERCFYVDIFRALSNLTMDKKKRSIPEIQRIVSEGMTMLGPIIGKIINETLNPTLDRTWNILERRGLFGDLIPDELKTMRKKRVFLSPLARAQKSSQMQGISTYAQFIGELSQFKQDVVDNMDADRVMQIVADIQGVDPTVQVEASKIARIRQQRAKMQQAQQAAAVAEQAASAAHKSGQAKKAMAESEAVGA